MIKVKGVAIPNMPWEEKPENYDMPMWRYSKNPVIGRNPVENVARIFNSAVVPYKNGEFAGVFRAETKNGVPYLYTGFSKDGLNWNFSKEAIKIYDSKGNDVSPNYAYDPRVVPIDGVYYVIWCTDFCGASLGIAKTTDFEHFESFDNPFLPFNRNGVLFPRKVNGKYLMLSRPSDSGHTPFGDVFLSESPDMYYWGRHKHVFGTTKDWWQSVKTGAGCAPIETDEGWLLFYHAVTGTCSGFVYSIGAALLDLEDPSKVLHRCKNFILTPEMEYEERGFVANVVFPVAALTDAPTGRIALYYGAADTYTALAFTTVEETINYIKKYDCENK